MTAWQLYINNENATFLGQFANINILITIKLSAKVFTSTFENVLKNLSFDRKIKAIPFVKNN